MTDEQQDTGAPAPEIGRSVDVELGDETRELLVRGEIDAALQRHDGSRREQPDTDDDRVSGDLGGADGDQEGGAG
jgi:hypothetical protein